MKGQRMTRTLMLSRLRLNLTSIEARRDILNRNFMHKTLCRIVNSSRTDGHILWRYEPDTDNSETALLLQSSVAPDPRLILPKYGGLDGPHDMKPHLDRLADGQQVRYRIIVNPVICVPRSNRRRTVPRSSIPEWWKRRAQSAGLLPDLDALRVFTDSEPHPRNRRALLYSARLDGIAAVGDAERLRESIRSGIGRSKAYGCGLLTVSKPF